MAVTVVVASVENAVSVGVAVEKVPSAVGNAVVAVEKVPSVGAVAVSAAKVANAAVVAIATKSKPIQNNLNKRRESSRRFFVSDLVTNKKNNFCC